MKISKNGVALIASFEGLRLSAYLCPKNKWTIGYGNTYYEDGRPVKMGDKLKNKQEAERLLLVMVSKFESSVNSLTAGIDLNQNQFDAIVSFSYNVGTGALSKSTILKIIMNDCIDPKIKDEFMKWVAGGTPGLIKRRKAEAQLYFKPITNS